MEDIQLIDEDQPLKLANEAKQKEALLLATQGTLEQHIRVLNESIPDNKTLLDNRPFEKCAELLEYVIHKGNRQLSYICVTIIRQRSSLGKT